MILCIDLDNVICKTKNAKYKNAKPIARMVKIINKAYNYTFKRKCMPGITCSIYEK